MDNLHPNPNKSRLIKPFSVLLLGALCLTGCSIDNNETTSPTQNTKPVTTEFITDNNCTVNGQGGGLMSNTDKTVREFAEDYVQQKSEETHTDLSICVDEVVDDMIHTPSNVQVGAGSPNARVNTVFVPEQITPR